MDLNYLDFERPIAELAAKIDELRRVGTDTEIDLIEEIKKLEAKRIELTKSIFSSLTPNQIVKLARHPLRPHAVDYIDKIFTDFDELHGDRHYSQGPVVIGGTARLGNKPVVVIGQEKGRSTKDKVEHNFGMPRPEDFRKALRLMQLAEKFKLPVFTFIDTPGAYPGVGAEERNQSEAIARNLLEMSQLKTPIICTVIGEGSSGGALAIGVGDRTLMLQYSIYAVISPEGCASILWKSAERAADAAEAMGVTPDRIQKLGLLDEIIPEPLGGAHRDVDAISDTLSGALEKHLSELQALSIDKLLDQRYQRLRSLGL